MTSDRPATDDAAEPAARSAVDTNTADERTAASPDTGSDTPIPAGPSPEPAVDHLPHPATADIRIADVLHALADPVRLDMVRQLTVEVELNCGRFEVPVSKSTLTHHLRTLRAAGVLQTRTQGTSRLSSLRRKELDDLFPGLLNGVLAARR